MAANDPDMTSLCLAEGPAFPVLIKMLSTGMMLAMLYWGVGALSEVVWQDFSQGAALLYGGASLISVVVYFWILKSRTSISRETIDQTWLWHKRVRIADIRQAKFIYVPYLSWLIAPRLVVRAGPGVNVFYSASPDVQRAFACLMSAK
jgi:hypothetical protein